MSAELMIANVVRQIIVKAWNEPQWKKNLLGLANAREELEKGGFVFPTYNGYVLYPEVKVVECIVGKTSYIVLPPNPTNAASKEPNILSDLAMVAARGNTVLGI
jgi:hypothetical protein